MTDPDVITRDADLAIRRMRDDPDDYALLVGWRNEPHVAEWWNTDDEPAPVTFEHVVDHYGPRTDSDGSTTSCIIERSGRPVGYTQFYRWADTGEEMRSMGFSLDDRAYGLDILIGEPSLIGSGTGALAVALLCRHLFAERGASRVALLTAERNVRAQRAYEKAGMRKVALVLDTDIKDGERVRSWLMVVDRPALPS